MQDCGIDQLASKSPLLSKLISSSMKVLPQMQDLLIIFSSLPGAQVLSCFLSSFFSFFSFFHPSQIYGNLSHPFVVSGLLLVSSRYFVRIAPFVDALLRIG